VSATLAQGTPAALACVHGEAGSPGTHLHGAAEVTVAGVTVVVDCDRALYWPDEGVLAIADLHLEKGSSFAARGVLLPPYDTAATLARLALLIARYAPRAVIALGDSFHDGDGPARISAADRAALVALQRGRDWIWIAGNHDPDPAIGIGGSFGAALAVGALIFRHEPTGAVGEIAGHLHPVARVTGRGRTVTRRCFASDGTRLVMPAFGAFAGGLNVRHGAFADVFGTLAFTAYTLGDGRIYALAAHRCLAD
jgi:DNA ligase-associated metallophosphoesterase